MSDDVPVATWTSDWKLWSAILSVVELFSFVKSSRIDLSRRFETSIFLHFIPADLWRYLQQSWGLVSGVQYLGFGVWDLGTGIYIYMGSGTWGLLSGFCGLEFETGVWDSRSVIDGLVFWVQDSGSGILGQWFRVHDSGSLIQGSWLGVYE